MISFEYRILSEFKIKKAKIDTLSNFILGHTDPTGIEVKEASEFLNVLINEIDKFYVSHSEILSNNGKRSLTIVHVYMKQNNGMKI
ncbi:MAG: hypothetical protein OEM28_06600 [Nitrosopumilus sp.]|nr:hypothetical protein [Nitrosopumilus sp.]MDH3487201.1 hypothetical protein [Nitrosopumilus sp.]